MNRSISQPELLNLFPNASRSCVEANTNHPVVRVEEERAGRKESDSATSGPKLERRATASTVGTAKAKAGDTASVLVRITSVRKRLIDADNLCEKYVLDCCRYAGLVPDDSPTSIRLETTQRKAGKEEREYTLIEIFEL